MSGPLKPAEGAVLHKSQLLSEISRGLRVSRRFVQKNQRMCKQRRRRGT